MSRVKDKAVLITGGGSGIGAATGELVCAEGGRAMLVDANAEALANTRKAIVERIPGAQVATFVADVAEANEADHAVKQALEVFGQRFNAQLFGGRGSEPCRVASGRQRQFGRRRQLLQSGASGVAQEPPREHRQRLVVLRSGRTQRHGSV